MGFFGRLFRRKRGGTFVGNLIRRVANHYSKGILGNGDGLRRWEARVDMFSKYR